MSCSRTRLSMNSMILFHLFLALSSSTSKLMPFFFLPFLIFNSKLYLMNLLFIVLLSCDELQYVRLEHSIKSEASLIVRSLLHHSAYTTLKTASTWERQGLRWCLWNCYLGCNLEFQKFLQESVTQEVLNVFRLYTFLICLLEGYTLHYCQRGGAVIVRTLRSDAQMIIYIFASEKCTWLQFSIQKTICCCWLLLSKDELVEKLLLETWWGIVEGDVFYLISGKTHAEKTKTNRFFFVELLFFVGRQIFCHIIEQIHY